MEKLTINVKVQPKARKAGLQKIGPDAFRVRVLAAPEKGAANREVVARIASFFGIPVSQVKILRGARSRFKVVEVGIKEVLPGKKR
jgi:uncharacterized protein (TIGR00251 family)